jgi:hypothetical protein
LGSDNPQVRMGAIYALEQIAHDSKAPLIARWHSFVADRAPGLVRSRSAANRPGSYLNYVATLLAALVRSRSHANQGAPHEAVLKVRAPDVQAALRSCRPRYAMITGRSPERQAGSSRSDLSRARLRPAPGKRPQLRPLAGNRPQEGKPAGGHPEGSKPWPSLPKRLPWWR